MLRFCSLCALVLPLAAPLSAQAGPLSTWGTQTSAGETWLTPYVFVDSGSVANNTYLSIGLGGRFDLIGGVGATLGFADGFEPGVVEAMPRFFLNDNVGVVLRVASVPGYMQLEVGPEVHAAWTAGRFAFTTNAGWRATVGDGGGLGTAFGVFAPEWFFGDVFSVYTEVNPTVDLSTGDVSLTLVPGAGLSMGAHGLAVGVTLPTDDPLNDYMVGAWYSVRVGAPASRRQVTERDGVASTDDDGPADGLSSPDRRQASSAVSPQDR